MDALTRTVLGSLRFSGFRISRGCPTLEPQPGKPSFPLCWEGHTPLSLVTCLWTLRAPLHCALHGPHHTVGRVCVFVFLGSNCRATDLPLDSKHL